MKTQRISLTVAAFLTLATTAFAGDLNVVGNLNVASNLTANVVTLQGATELTSAVLDFAQPGLFYRYTLSTDTTWVFTNHVAGRQVWLQVAQDDTGGWRNTWPADLLWPDDHPLCGSSAADKFSVFKILDNGSYWLAQAEGLNYRVPCVTNCEGALEFDGAQNYLTSAAMSACNNLSAFTIEFWYKSTATAENLTFIAATDNWQATGGHGFFLHLDSDGSGGGVLVPQIWVYNAGWPSNSPNIENATDGNWHHVAVTAGENGYNTWFDGSNVNAQDAPDHALLTGNTRIFVGGAYDLSGDEAVGQFFNGTIDEVRISSAERYTEDFTPECSLGSDESTIVYWKLNDGTGAAAADSSGNNHNATLNGDPLPLRVDGVASGCNQMGMSSATMSSTSFIGPQTNAMHQSTSPEP